MKATLLLGAFLVGALLPQGTPYESYENYKVYTLTLFTKFQIEALEQLNSQFTIDTWQEVRKVAGPRNNRMREMWTTDIMVTPAEIPAVEEFFAANDISFKTKIENVGTIVAQERKSGAVATKKAGVNAINWTQYHRYQAISDWVNEVVANNSDIATVSVIGKSTEGRDLQLVKISKPGSPANKNAIFIDGGFHAREWISPAIATFIIDQLLNHRDENAGVLDYVDLYVVPIVNVDGYEFSHTNTRMWRKTRSRVSGSTCYGVDPNRNFDFHFGGAGTSNSPCSDIYRGPKAYSEPEVAALRDVLLDKTKAFQAYFTLHSYGQYWLFPWSYDYVLPDDYVELMRFGDYAAAALSSIHGTRYQVDASCNLLGTTAGCSDDWAKGVAGIKYATTIEVRDRGTYGFALPPAQIIPTATETWAAIKSITNYDFVNHVPGP